MKKKNRRSKEKDVADSSPSSLSSAHCEKRVIELQHKNDTLKDQADLVQSSVSAGSNTNMSEEFIDAARKPVSGLCCSCSKKSLCKTSKCGCRAAVGICGIWCGCAVSKCTNREVFPIMIDDALQSQMTGLTLNCPGIIETEKKTVNEKPPEMK